MMKMWLIVCSALGIGAILTPGATQDAATIYTGSERIALVPNRPHPPSWPIPDYDVRQLFPIHTPAMRAGRFEPSHAPHIALEHLRTPLFLVGTDTYSSQWLSQHRTTLQAHKAIGFVIEAPHYEAFIALSTLVPELLMIPVPGQQLAEVLGLTVYPLMLTRTGIWQ